MKDNIIDELRDESKRLKDVGQRMIDAADILNEIINRYSRKER